MSNDTLEVSKFIRLLKKYKLSKQQRKTLKGQAISGDLEGAKKGLEKLTAFINAMKELNKLR